MKQRRATEGEGGRGGGGEGGEGGRGGGRGGGGGKRVAEIDEKWVAISRAKSEKFVSTSTKKGVN
jgi:hypothetical protein